MNNKKIIFQVTRRYMKRNRRRTAITFLGILLMVILMTCVFVGKDTVVNYLQNVAALHTGSWHLTAHGLNAETSPGWLPLRALTKSDILCGWD